MTYHGGGTYHYWWVVLFLVYSSIRYRPYSVRSSARQLNCDPGHLRPREDLLSHLINLFFHQLTAKRVGFRCTQYKVALNQEVAAAAAAGATEVADSRQQQEWQPMCVLGSCETSSFTSSVYIYGTMDCWAIWCLRHFLGSDAPNINVPVLIAKEAFAAADEKPMRHRPSGPGPIGLGTAAERQAARRPRAQPKRKRRQVPQVRFGPN